MPVNSQAGWNCDMTCSTKCYFAEADEQHNECSVCFSAHRICDIFTFFKHVNSLALQRSPLSIWKCLYQSKLLEARSDVMLYIWHSLIRWMCEWQWWVKTPLFELQSDCRALERSGRKSSLFIVRNSSKRLQLFYSGALSCWLLLLSLIYHLSKPPDRKKIY